MADPKLECDLVMRGGIASGLVYPKAVAELSESYRFRQIGGTSAGAIAAAATAAAEYGRREGKRTYKEHKEPFTRLAEIPGELAERGRGPRSRSKLFRLFWAQPETAPFYKIVLALMRSGGKSIEEQFLAVIGVLFLSFPIAAIIGALPGVAAALTLVGDSRLIEPFSAGLSTWVATLLFVGGAAVVQIVVLFAFRSLPVLALSAVLLILGMIAWSVAWPAKKGAIDPAPFYDLVLLIVTMVMIYMAAAGATLSGFYAAARRARTAIPNNMYGLCSGFGPPRRDGTPQLTVWLHEVIQDLAGRSADQPPLTVGDLKGSGVMTDKSVDVALMTTNITRGMSHCFPRLEGNGGWRGKLYFKKSELEKLFPKSVVEWMVGDRPALTDLVDKMGKPIPGMTDVFPLPPPDKLPILLGARMSMSFPFLLSAVPLYVQTETDWEGNTIMVQRCWFSDGGLTSNFPIHFFDSPVPRRPTFGISLAYHTTEFKNAPFASPEGFEPSANWRKYGRYIWMPNENEEGADSFARFNDFEQAYKISGFFGALFEASREWSDNEIINMPGYRDRIVHVKLEDDEGGYNIDMPQDVIEAIATKGKLAGELLAARFAPNPDQDPKTGQRIRLTWDNHRWIRYRAFMASLEDLARPFERRWEETGPDIGKGIKPLRSLIEKSFEDFKDSDQYPWNGADQFTHAIDTTRRFAAFVQSWQAPHQTFDWMCDAPAGRSPRPKPRLRVVPPDDSAD